LAILAFWILPLMYAIPTSGALLVATFLTYTYLMKGLRRPVITGIEAMKHAHRRVRSLQGDIAVVWVNSELWLAQAGEELHEGDQIQVVGVEGLRLRVRKVILGAKEEPDAECHG
jgi:membrane-bound ClpP family serine protease